MHATIGSAGDDPSANDDVQEAEEAAPRGEGEVEEGAVVAEEGQGDAKKDEKEEAAYEYPVGFVGIEEL